MKKVCKKCNIKKNINEFTYYKNTDCYLNTCKKCVSDKLKSKYIKKEKVSRKIKHFCTICTTEVFSYLGKDGKDSYMYPKICSYCLLKKKAEKKALLEKIKEEKFRLENEERLKNIETEFIPKGVYLETLAKDDKRILKSQFKKILLSKIPKFCKFCSSEINGNNTMRSLLDKGYCSEWCEEVENPLELTNFCYCGNATSTFKYQSGERKGQSNGQYRKWCERCIKVGKHLERLKNNKQKK